MTVVYNSRPTSLHRLWDSILVQELADRAGGTDALVRNIVKAAQPRFCVASQGSWNESWMDDVVAQANSIHMLNCRVVWRDELRLPEVLLPVMKGLLVDAAAFSACHWDRLVGHARGSHRHDKKHADADDVLKIQP